MTAVEWLIQELKKVHHPTEAMIMYAKKLEKRQIMEAVSFGDCRGRITTYLTDEQYYNETYGSKGSDEQGSSLEWNGEVTQGSNGNFKQFSLYEHKETIATTNTPTSSQTEISDEEIEKLADEFALKYYTSGVTEDEVSAFVTGMKWYREQLKKKI